MSKMDSFTSAALLSAVANGADNNEVADLYKAFSSEQTDGPSPKAIEWFNLNKGRKVRLLGGNVGTLESLNESTCGLYNGERYPFKIRLENGELYDYGMDSIEELL